MKRKITFIAWIFLFTFASRSNVFSQWVKIGPHGGKVNALIVNSSTVIVGTTGGGIFRSLDSGKTWTQANIGLTDTNVLSLAKIEDTLFAGTSSAGIFRSTNNGLSWTAVNNGLAFYPIPSFATIGTVLFAKVENDGLFRSSDNGANWVSVWTNSEITSIAAIGGILFVNSEKDAAGSVYRSNDTGKTWAKADSIGLIVMAAVGNTLLGSPYHISGGHPRMYRSIDSGMTWIESDNGIPESQYQYFDHISSVGSTIFTSPGANNPYFSTDGGETWSLITSISAINTCAIIGDILLAGNDSGIYRSIGNDTTWVPSNEGMFMFYTQAPQRSNLASMGATLFTSSSIGVMRTSDFGINWAHCNNGLTDSYYGGNAIAVFGNRLYVNPSHEIFLSTDEGNSWTHADTSGLPKDLTGTLSINNFALIDNNLFVSSNWGIFHTTDIGVGWEYGGYKGSVYSVFIIGRDFYAALRDGTILISKDTGISWTTISLPISNGYLSTFGVAGSIFFSQWNDGAGHSTVFRSIDFGMSWSNNISGLNRFSSLATIGTDIFAGDNETSTGVSLSTDNGMSWNTINNGLTDLSVFSVEICGPYLFAGTLYGIWRRPLSDFGISDVKNSTLPNLNISLSPNPTNGIVIVHNATSNIMHVTIMNVLGETVSEAANSGAADFTIDLSKLPPGTYFARFAGGGSVITRKILKE